MRNLKTGTIIAIAAGSLFAAACSKKSEEAKQAPPSATPTPTTQTPAEADKPKTDTPAATAPSGSGEKTATMYCKGVNACKGQGACKSAANDCAGKNACAAKGFLMLTQAECDAAKAKAKK